VLDETKSPGVGVALVTKDDLFWVAGLGKADLDAGEDLDTDTHFRIGSISKTFISLSVLKLQEQGLLNLEDGVRELVPEIEFTNPFEETEPVRLIHLLKHTAGFDDIHSLLESSWPAPGPGLDKDPTAHLLFAVDLILARCHRPGISHVADS